MANAATRLFNQSLRCKPRPAVLPVHDVGRVMRRTRNSVDVAVFRSELRRWIGARQNLLKYSVAAVTAVIQREQNSAGAAENRSALDATKRHKKHKASPLVFVPFVLLCGKSLSQG